MFMYNVKNNNFDYILSPCYMTKGCPKTTVQLVHNITTLLHSKNPKHILASFPGPCSALCHLQYT